MGAYWTCNDCNNYDPERTNYKGWGYCTERGQYYPKSDPACSNKFEHKTDYVPSGCFLTTAICNIFGYDDDCYGLNLMRNFRDTILIADRKYYPLLAKYEVIGPIISEKLYNDPHRDEVAGYYFENYIYDILINLANETNYEEVVNKYLEMGYDMMRMYGVTKEVTNSDVSYLTKQIQDKKYKVKKK